MTAVQTRYRVTGMDCGACAAKVEAAVRRLPEVESVSVSATAGTMTVRHQPHPALLPALKASLTGLGYDITPAEPHRGGGPARAHSHHDETTGLHSHVHERGLEAGPWWHTRKTWLTIACGLALAVAYGIGKLVPAAEQWVFIAAMAVGLIPIARRAFLDARNGIPFSIEMLMTIAAVGAVLIGAAEEAAVVVFLFLVGELLEGVAAGRARASINGLTALVPKTAFLEESSQTREVPADSLNVGATILVRPGDRIPADGVIVEGESEVNEAPVTGESTPKRKRVEDNVFAGTVNGDAALRVRVTAAAADNT
ncbi:MAG: heavy metal translocating P-type ATPase, partial [Beijerinckiaceae bacterium]